MEPGNKTEPDSSTAGLAGWPPPAIPAPSPSEQLAAPARPGRRGTGAAWAPGGQADQGPRPQAAGGGWSLQESLPEAVHCSAH